jgi:cytochrome c
MSMRKVLTILLLACLSSITGFAHADYDLLVKSNCLACHYLDKRKYGPKLNEISSKYVNDAKALEKLAKKIKDGGTGVWGEDVMPPQPQLSDADALALAKYVLSLK